jgi:hypothetical protein
MGTSVLSMKFLSQGSVWKLSGEDSVQSEETAVSGEAGLSTDSESRHADTHVGEVDEDGQRMKDLVDGLKEIRKALEEVRTE